MTFFTVQNHAEFGINILPYADLLLRFIVDCEKGDCFKNYLEVI